MGSQDDEHESFGVPLPPADRIWRHPAEVAAEDRSAGRSSGRRRRRGRALFFSASALSGAGVVLLALAAIGEFSDGDRSLVASATSLPETALTGAPPTTATFNDLAQAETSMAAITRVRASTPDGMVYGSGVFLPDDGHLLTAASVVNGVDEVTVWLDSGVALPGIVVGTDEENDVAVIRVIGQQFPHAVLGTAKALSAGDTALIVDASGSQKDGIRLTVSSVIATHRRVEFAERAMYGMVQLDSPDGVARPGIVLARDGTVVGIVTSQGSSPGYVITIDWAMRIADDLIDDGEVDYAWLGIEGTDVRPDDADIYGTMSGARVIAVADASPAAEAGMTAGDVIISVDGEQVRSMGDLVLAVRLHRPGDTVNVRYLRDGTERGWKPVLGAARSTQASSAQKTEVSVAD